MKKIESKISWAGKIVAEAGGPLLIANCEDAVHWRGEAATTMESGYCVEVRGALWEKIPNKFRKPDFSLVSRSREEAIHLFEELKSVVGHIEKNSTFEDSNSVIEGEIDRTYFRDGEPILRVLMKVITDFVRGYNKLNSSGDEFILLPIISDHKGIIWSIEGSGVIRFGVSVDGNQVIALRTWVTEDEDEIEANTFVESMESKTVEKENSTDPIFTVKTQGKVMGVWSPMDCSKKNLESLSEGSVTWNEVEAGYIFRLNPGIYKIRSGQYQSKRWSCRWLRLVATRIK